MRVPYPARVDVGPVPEARLVQLLRERARLWIRGKSHVDRLTPARRMTNGGHTCFITMYWKESSLRKRISQHAHTAPALRGGALGTVRRTRAHLLMTS